MQRIKQFQDIIEQELNKLNISGHPAELYDPINYIIQLGGKRLRPALVLLGCDLFNGTIENAIKPAVAIELFHNFTLMHDDIMDNAPIRRGKPTVHEQWNTNIAILSGDALFVKAYQLMCSVDAVHIHKVLEVFNRTSIEVCEGQQLDMNFESRADVSIGEYENMIALKTSVLLAAALKIGAIIANAGNEDAMELYEFGRSLGIAFQLQDDILDVYGDADKVGKVVGGDIIADKKTFLLLKAFELANQEQHGRLKAYMGKWPFVAEDKVIQITKVYDEIGVRAFAEAEVKRYSTLAIDHLNNISVSEEKKQDLRAFAEALMNRSY